MVCVTCGREVDEVHGVGPAGEPMCEECYQEMTVELDEKDDG